MMSPPITVDRAPGKAPYTISKFGMTFLAQSIAEEMRPHNVAANALWPVTGIDTQATRVFWPGQEKYWRKPEIIADATVAIVRTPPAARTGQALLDEEVLRAAGVTDFAKYQNDESVEPPPFSKLMFGGASDTK
jgi:NAD(P)-dependent dehydrogenase (short-subunit alcohol dehydrogenase family)